MLGLFMAPVWWVLVGRMLASQRHRAAVIMLIVHAATVALVLYGAPGEHREEEWRYIRIVERALPGTMWGGIILYAVGQLVAWWVTIAGAIRRTPSREVT